MLKYKLLEDRKPLLVWNIKLLGKLYPTVGNYLYEISKTPSEQNVERTVYIYRHEILVASAIFKNGEGTEWNGPAEEIWDMLVDKCEMISHSHQDYVYRIYIKEPKQGAHVVICPIIPKLLDAIARPIPVY